MSNYSENEGSVRMSLFKPSGKWYSDSAVDMSAHYNTSCIHTAVSLAWNRPLEPGWILICLEPYHQHSHPVMLKG